MSISLGTGVSLGLGDRVVLPQVNDPTAPALAFGDGDSGFYELSDDALGVTFLGVLQFLLFTGQFHGADVDAGALLNEAASATNPTLLPSRSDIDTGVGYVSTDVGALVAGGVNVQQFGEAGAAPLLGFFGTAAGAQPTGVAVSAAGVHAALVTLGLITA